MAAKILVCDDEPHIVHVVAAKLRGAGFEVLTAGDGQEGLDLAREAHPDLIFTDYQMPSLSGLELCARLRADPATRDIPAVMLSARGFSIGDEDLTHTNIRKVLPKPFSPREVLSIARELLEGAAAGAR
ncbi:Alkaline phosphatase synthesis transcriptional regulatory protein PhoP [Phycisphaerae bacterium RAS2]|nr:Alkaline phosphatase synthesis transcriptional regulatory protein PhoP [Phycisphaerae bacterium RAS2]